MKKSINFVPHPYAKACTLHVKLIGNQLAQLMYKDAIQVVAQAVTISLPDLYQAPLARKSGLFKKITYRG